MARVTRDEVREIIETDLTNDQVDAIIDVANRLVTNRLGSATCHTVQSLTDVELYLSAHLIGLRTRQLTREKIGPAEEDFGGNFGMMLDFTQYGQTAKILDCSGILGNIGKIRVVLHSFGDLDE